jgi:hypothetical protein
MDMVFVCVYSVCVVLCLGRGLATSWSLAQGVLPSVKWSWNWKQRPGPKGALEPVKNTNVRVRWDVWNYAVSVYHSNKLPITVAARSEAWTVSSSSNTAIVGSNSTWGLDVCMRLFCVCAVLCVGSGLVTRWSPVQGVLPTV